MLGWPMLAAELTWKEIFDFSKGRQKQSALVGKATWKFLKNGQAAGLTGKSFLGKAWLVRKITRSIH
jgi:hypothetical protein